MRVANWINWLGLSAAGIWATIRFGVVGVVATVVYLGSSLFFLGQSVEPHVANFVAFGVATTVSYLGHYFFTYRATGHHLRQGSRFIAVTVALVTMSMVFQHLCLHDGASPRFATLILTGLYPLLCFLLNHFWAFSRGHLT